MEVTIKIKAEPALSNYNDINKGKATQTIPTILEAKLYYKVKFNIRIP